MAVQRVFYRMDGVAVSLMLHVCEPCFWAQLDLSAKPGLAPGNTSVSADLRACTSQCERSGHVWAT